MAVFSFKREMEQFREKMAERIKLAHKLGMKEFIIQSQGYDLIETAHCFKEAFHETLTQEWIDYLLDGKPMRSRKEKMANDTVHCYNCKKPMIRKDAKCSAGSYHCDDCEPLKPRIHPNASNGWGTII